MNFFLNVTFFLPRIAFCTIVIVVRGKHIANNLAENPKIIGEYKMEAFQRINNELNYLSNAGLIEWLEDDLGLNLLLDDVDLHLEYLSCWYERSRLVSFLLSGEPFHFILYFDSQGNQESARFFWDTEKKLTKSVANFENSVMVVNNEGNESSVK